MNRMIAVAALALVAVGCRSKTVDTPPPPAGLPLDGVWRATVQGRAKVVVLRERADGRIVGFVAGDPVTVVTGGARQASAVSVSLTTAEPSGTSDFTLTGTLQGDRLTLALDEGGTPVTLEYRRVTQPLAFEEWTFADDGSGRRVRAAAVRDGGSIVGGGFVGVDGCAFAACAGDVTAWDASGALRSVVTSSGGDCSTTATFSGSWDGSARVLSGPFSVASSCAATMTGTFTARKDAVATSDEVGGALAAMARLADAIEAESASAADVFPSTYRHEGKTRADWQGQLALLYAAYDGLVATAGSIRRAGGTPDGEVKLGAPTRPWVEWHLVVTGVPAAGGARRVVLDLTAALDADAQLLWTSTEAGRTSFAGDGTACREDLPVDGGLFVFSPTNVGSVASIVPLGNMNPGGNHVLPVDHMYLRYPDTGSAPGADVYAVHAMARGRLAWLYRQTKDGVTSWDYDVWIRHTCSVTTRVVHLYELSPRISAYLEASGAQWKDLGGMAFLMLGQTGTAPMLEVAAGEELGLTRNYSNSWDVGVVDERFVNGTFANPAPSRFPSQLAALGEILAGVDPEVYGSVGNQTVNAGCFVEYLTTVGDLRAQWFDKLESSPKGCGRVGWDTPGHLRGVWFHPAIDTAGLLMDLEVAALSIVPDNLFPDSGLQIGWGNANISGSHPELAQLDPSTWTTPVSGVERIYETFPVAPDSTPGVVVDPDPALVGTGTTVCYDLPFWGISGPAYDYLLLRLTDETHLRALYVPGAYATAQCSALEGSFPEVDEGWAQFIR